jgi:hypothetical protein
MAKQSYKKRKEAVKLAWEIVEDNEPDISTERLMAMVSDMTGEDAASISSMIVDNDE